MILEEEYFEGHLRGIKVDVNNSRLYSIDHYQALKACEYKCEEKISIRDYELCYVKLGLCEAVIVQIRNNIKEMISLRLKTEIASDPAKGSIAKAREICLKELKDFLESGCFGVQENK